MSTNPDLISGRGTRLFRVVPLCDRRNVFTCWACRLDKSSREPGALCELADTLPFPLSDASASPSPKASAYLRSGIEKKSMQYERGFHALSISCKRRMRTRT